MIVRLHNPEGRCLFLASDFIAQVSEAGASSQWHGIRSIVKTKDGKVLECGDTAEEVSKKIEAVNAQSWRLSMTEDELRAAFEDLMVATFRTTRLFGSPITDDNDAPATKEAICWRDAAGLYGIKQLNAAWTGYVGAAAFFGWKAP